MHLDIDILSGVSCSEVVSQKYSRVLRRDCKSGSLAGV